jgi:hypothetical protein
VVRDPIMRIILGLVFALLVLWIMSRLLAKTRD